MKNKLFILLTLIVVNVTSITAQEEETDKKNTTTFGIRGGINGSFSKSFFETEFYGGLFAETRLSKHWSIQNELNVSYGGSNDTSLGVPIFIKYYFTDKFSVFGGPRLDVNISRGFINQVNGPVNSFIRLPSPVGLSAEIGGQYNITKRFFVEARYNYSIINAPRLDNNNLQIGFGFKF